MRRIALRTTRSLAIISALLGLLCGAPIAAAADPSARHATTATATAGAATPTNAIAVCPGALPDMAHCDAVLRVRPGTEVPVRPRLGPVLASGRRARLSGLSAIPPAPGSPQWLQQIYDLTALSADRGTGDTVAIVDAYDDPAAASDLAAFRRSVGLSACTTASGCLQIVNQAGQSGPLPGVQVAWGTEESLDLEAVSAICPNCRLLLVEANSPGAGDLHSALQTAADLGADQISASWSITASASPFPVPLLRPRPGQPQPAVFAAAGDQGTDGAGWAEYPAALAQVTAIGGTSLAPSTDDQPRGVRESAWASAGSGCAPGLGLSLQPATGCAGRAYSDISADADPMSGLDVYEAAAGGWLIAGGTSLATPMVAAFAAISGADASSPAWAYADAGAWNHPTGGSNGSCAPGLLALMCTATGAGYSGPGGAGSISGAIVAGAPSPALPLLDSHGSPTAAPAGPTAGGATLTEGLYTNQESTTYLWQYGITVGYGQQTPPAQLPGALAPALARAPLSGLMPGTTYHCRLIATNASGTTVGPDLTFTTLAASRPASAVPSRPANAATGTRTRVRRRHKAGRRSSVRGHRPR